MGNRLSNHQRTKPYRNSSSSEYIPKPSSAPSRYSSNVISDNNNVSSTTIKVASKINLSNYTPTNSTSETARSSKANSTNKHYSSSDSRGFSPTTSSVSFPLHSPKTYDSGKVKCVSPSSSPNAFDARHCQDVSKNFTIHQPDIGSRTSTPSISHQSSTESIQICPTNQTPNSSLIYLKKSTDSKTTSNVTNTQQSYPTPSISSFYSGTVIDSQIESPPSFTNSQFKDEMIIERTSPKTMVAKMEDNLQQTSPESKITHVESFQDFSFKEDSNGKNRDELHHSITLPDMSLPSSLDFQQEPILSPSNDSMQRSISFSVSSPRSKPVFLAIQNSAHVSSRRKLKLSKSTQSNSQKIEAPQTNTFQQPEIVNISSKKENAFTFSVESNTIAKLSPVNGNIDKVSNVNTEAKKNKVVGLSLLEETSMGKSAQPLFKPSKTKEKKSSSKFETKPEDNTNNINSPSLKSNKKKTTLAQTLFSSSDERKSFCAAALDHQKNWFNGLMGGSEQVTFEQQSNSLQKSTNSFKCISSINSQTETTNIFDTRRRHSVFESKNITVVPLIAVSCPPNPAQSPNQSKTVENTGRLLSINSERKARIAKKKRPLNTPATGSSDSANYSNLSSYKMASKKSK